LSRNPSDALIFVPETTETNLVFRVKISEPANCNDDPKYLPLRSTQLQVVRIHTRNSGNTPPPEEVLTESTMTAYNPMCIVNGGTVTLTYQNVRFSCHYYGTEGLASQVMRKNSPSKTW